MMILRYRIHHYHCYCYPNRNQSRHGLSCQNRSRYDERNRGETNDREKNYLMRDDESCHDVLNRLMKNYLMQDNK